MTPKLREIINLDYLEQIPDGIENSMTGAWKIFRFVTADAENSQYEEAWFELIAKVAPGKDQIDFTTVDWENVIREIRERE